jgi:hypothetical protein
LGPWLEKVSLYLHAVYEGFEQNKKDDREAVKGTHGSDVNMPTKVKRSVDLSDSASRKLYI